MERETWRDVLRGAEPEAGLAELFDELERCGWYARGRNGQFGLRFWPDNQRYRQIVLTINHPLNEHKLLDVSERTGLALDLEIKEPDVNEGGKR